MNADTAKKTLDLYRSGDEITSEVAEALACARTNPQLARWFAGKESFDRQLGDAVGSIPVPRDLRSSILGQRKVVFLRRWWQQPVSYAAAALILGLVGLAGFFLSQPKQTFAEYRKTIVDESWGRAPHLDLETSDIDEVNRWVVGMNATSGPISVPSGLKDMTLRGSRTVEWKGQHIVCLCFVQGPRHMHLFVTDEHAFVDAPRQSMPDYEKCAGWKTVSWTQGERTYVLTGMNYITFLKKFRHSGHWTMDG
jgi:hypothetical protein